MSQYSDPEGTFASLRTAAAPADVASYRAVPQFGVSLAKLAVMSLCTFGVYQDTGRTNTGLPTDAASRKI